MNIRHIKSSDYEIISPLINEWWGGRQMSHMLPKLFIIHFKNTSFIVEKGDQVVGFLIGLFSPSQVDEGYIHFVGVHPDYRRHNIGMTLYHTFFSLAQKNGIKLVRAITSPVNKKSIAFHTNLGFEIEDGTKEVDGISVFPNYDGPNEDRVLFKRKL